MSTGNIETILTGDKQLDDQDIGNLKELDIPEIQRERTIEILNYIKR